MAPRAKTDSALTDTYTLLDGTEVKVGDWVSVRVRVASRTMPSGGVNPFTEEVVVMARSHNEDILLPVLREHVIGLENPPGGWPRCTSLAMVPGQQHEVLARCTRDDGHTGGHEHPMLRWDDGDQVDLEG